VSFTQAARSPAYNEGHRGKEHTNLGAFFTDVVGVLFKHRVPQMCSANISGYRTDGRS